MSRCQPERVSAAPFCVVDIPRRTSRAWSVVLLVASLLCAGFGPPVITERQPDGLRLYPEHIAAAYRLAHPPAVTAGAALAVDLDADQTLYALNPTKPLPPASTAKLLTALIAVQRLTPDAVVVVSPRAAGTQGSRMGLATGERLTVQDLLYGLMLASGNDAAVALAEAVAGSETAFAVLMNKAAVEYRLAGSQFVNSHGLDEPGQVVTAADLLILAKAALAHPLLGKIMATQRAQVAGHALTNTNELLGVYSGTDGVKTGTTDEAGECLIVSVTRDRHRLVVVLLGSRDRYRDARTVLDFIAAAWQWRPVVAPQDASGWVLDQNGARYRLRAGQSRELFLPRWQWSQAQRVVSLDATAPFTGTLPVGTMSVMLGGRPLASAPLAVWPGP